MGVLGLAIFSGRPALAAASDPYAYSALHYGDFGVIDLKTGAFKLCGNSGTQLVGLAVGTGGTLFSGDFLNTNIYTVNPSSGALTTVGQAGVNIYLIGSTTTTVRGLPTMAVYFVGADYNLYKLNQSTGATTLIGPTRIAVGGYTGMSTGSGALYVSVDDNLYSVSTKTGKGTKLGTGSVSFGALVTIGGKLYGGIGPSINAVYAVTPKNAADTFVANVTGDDNVIWGLAPTPKTIRGACPH